MRFTVTTDEPDPLNIEVGFSRWGFSFQLKVRVNQATMLDHRWYWWPERSHWGFVLIGPDCSRVLRVQIEKPPWWRVPGLRPFAHRVFLDDSLIAERSGY
jgi:hypothetical protein